MSLLIQAVLNMTSKKKRKSFEKKRVTATYKFTDLRSKLTPQESFLGVWGQRLKQEQRKKMGGSKKRRLADRDGHLFTNFPLGSNPCSLRRIHTDSAGAGLSQLRQKGPRSFAKQPKSMSLHKTRSKSQSPDKLSLKTKKEEKNTPKPTVHVSYFPAVAV